MTMDMTNNELVSTFECLKSSVHIIEMIDFIPVKCLSKEQDDKVSQAWSLLKEVIDDIELS